MKSEIDMFEVGDRVFFTGTYGLGYFGNVIAKDRESQRLQIRTDGFQFCDCQAKYVTNLSRGKRK